MSFGRYTYEIVGGILIFVSSLVGEEMPPTWKKRSYIGFGVLALAFMAIGIYLDRDADQEQGKLQQSVSTLKASFDQSETARNSEREAQEKARQSDRDAFLKQLSDLGREVSIVRANVQTEDLRKQLENTQRSLHETQQALEKREVKLDFIVNGQVNPEETSIQRQRVLNTTTEQFVLSFALMNNSDEDAASGHAEVSIICTDCKGIRFVGVDPWPYWNGVGQGVARDFVEVSKHSSLQLGRVALISDTGPFPKQVRLAYVIDAFSAYRKSGIS